jgi:hypothetical protein
MDTLSHTKEEFTDNDKLDKPVKEEDNNEVKREDAPLAVNNPMQMNFPPFFPPRGAWLPNMMRPPYMPHLPSMYNYFNQTMMGQFPQKKVFPSFHEVKPSEVLPFVGIPGMENIEPVKSKLESLLRPKKKAVRVSACKNYIGLLCAGFSRAILTSERTSPILQFTSDLITQRKPKFIGAETQTIEQLVETFRVYVHQNICGKKVKKSNRERDFKVRNSEELDQLLVAQQNDTELTCLRKEILREMFNFFFTSECYEEWLNKGMISESNRIFFLRNKKEIQKKFQNPAYYKPRFNHSQDEVLA